MHNLLFKWCSDPLTQEVARKDHQGPTRIRASTTQADILSTWGFPSG